VEDTGKGAEVKIGRKYGEFMEITEGLKREGNRGHRGTDNLM